MAQAPQSHAWTQGEGWHEMEEKRNRIGYYGLQRILYLICSDRGTVAAAVRNMDVHSGCVKLDSAIWMPLMRHWAKLVYNPLSALSSYRSHQPSPWQHHHNLTLSDSLYYRTDVGSTQSRHKTVKRGDLWHSKPPIILLTVGDTLLTPSPPPPIPHGNADELTNSCIRKFTTIKMPDARLYWSSYLSESVFGDWGHVDSADMAQHQGSQ